MAFLTDPSVGWVLDFIIKGSLLLLFAYGAMRIFKPAVASERFFIRSLFFYIILLLPALSYGLPKLNVSISEPETIIVKNEAEIPPSTQKISADLPPAPAKEVGQTAAGSLGLWESLTFSEKIVAFWALVALAVYSKLLFGLLAVWVNSKRATIIHDRDINLLAIDISNQLGLKRHVKLLTSPKAMTPMTWGIFQPFVLLPSEALSWSRERLKYVLIHEFSHIERKDFVQHMLLQITCALFWFHPAVWTLSKQLIADRETACDDAVLGEGAKASAYAEHLIDIAKVLKVHGHSTYATVCMAKHNQLEGRLLSILDGAKTSAIHSSRKIGFIAGLLLLALPLAALQPIEAEPIFVKQKLPEPAIERAAFEPASRALAEPTSVPMPSAAARGGVEDKVAAFKNDLRDAIDSGVDLTTDVINQAATEVIDAIDDIDINLDENDFSPRFARDYRKNLAEEDSLSVEDLIRLKKYGVNADYIKAIKDQDFSRITLEDIIKFAKYGVTVDFIKALKSAGFKRVTPSEIIDAAKYGVSAEYITEVREIYSNASLDDITDMAKYGVSTEFIASVEDAGYKINEMDEITDAAKYGVSPSFIKMVKKYYPRTSLDDVSGMAKYGVNEKLIRTLHESGLKDLSADNIIDAAKYGVSPSYIAEIRDFYPNATLEDISDMSKYGVRASFVETIKDADYDIESMEEIIDAAKYGVSSAYIKMAKKHFPKISLEGVSEMAKYGVRESLIRTLSESKFEGVGVSEIIDCAKYGVSSSYIEEMNDLDLKRKLSLDEIADMAKYGVSVSYAKSMESVGFENLDADALIDFSKYGVSTTLVKTLEENGYEDLSSEEIIDCAKYGVRVDLIKALNKHGYKNIDIDDLIDASKYGLTARYIREVHDEGLKNLSLNQLIQMRKHGVSPKYIKQMKELDEDN